ncbi:MAG: hypothetical protein RBU37_00940, partial [Myxococcota bacterium]|nr:hypothetical protein [Myxococcota bacterium]
MQSIEQSMQCQKLNEVIHTVHDLTRRRVSSLAIFDLDGTLLDNRPRTIYILKEIAEFFDDEVPQLCKALEAPVDFSQIAYTIPDTLERLGVSSPTEIAFIEEEWA